jgi:predicted DNA-binding WGR domain protein
MAKRYFEYKDAKSKKFWEVSVTGKKVNIRYGKIGTDGQTSLKELSTPAEAKAHAEKQAAGKVKKGYKEAKAKAVKKAAKKKTIKKKTTKKVSKKVAKKAPAKGKASQVDQKARKAILKAVKEDGYALENADKIFKADREIVLAAVKQHENALRYATESLKADREIVLAAVKQGGRALEYGAKSLKADREIVLAAVKQNASALQYADKSLKADRGIVLKAIKLGGSIEQAAKSLKADREVVLAAVKQHRGALDHASEALQKDQELRKIAGKEDEELQSKELTVCGSQLNVDLAEYSLSDVNSKKKLRKVLLDYIPKRDQGDRDSGLLSPPDSAEDSAGNSVEPAIKSSGDLIPRPKKGKVLFLAYYFYGGEVYKVPLNSDEPVTAIGKEFDGETYITGYVQGNQELYWDEKGEGQHDGSLSWAFLVNDKSQSMSHLGIDAEIDGESETEIIDDMVDDVFASLEEYL